jgi:hypothetical protein
MLMPEPGSLDVLDDDEECASDILTVVRIVASGRRSRGPLRFVIASWWVGPRVPSPVTDRKRGKATRSGRWPHSPAALAATVEANERGGAPKLVAEHVTLVGDLVDSLVAEADTLTAPELATRLHAEHRFAVITPEEDRQLTAAGLEQAMPEGWRPGDEVWARYLAAGLDPSTLRRCPPMSPLSPPGCRVRRAAEFINGDLPLLLTRLLRRARRLRSLAGSPDPGTLTRGKRQATDLSRGKRSASTR